MMAPPTDRQWRRFAAGFLFVVSVAAAHPATAGAADEPGVRSRVVGRGDIVTSILGWSRSSRRTSNSGTPQPCSWRTLNDAQLEWLVSVGAEAVGLGFDTPLLEPLRPHMDGQPLPDGDLQGHVCGVDTTELRFVPSTTPQDLYQRIHRRMITHLPAPEPLTSPPAATAVPVGQPVFFWVDPQQWRPIETTLEEGGIVAQVRARPETMRIVTGDPATSAVTCDGPGRPFDDSTGRSARAQARHRDACVTSYATASAGHRSNRSTTRDDNRPDLWLGTVTVVWRAEWRVGDGPWMDLGSIPRTRLITRAARDVSTSLQSDS